MHLFYLNLPDLLISLFRGEMDCEATDNKADWDWMVSKKGKARDDSNKEQNASGSGTQQPQENGDDDDDDGDDEEEEEEAA